MKIAVSIPEDIFQQADEFAHHKEMSRSALYTCALIEYLAHHVPDHVTDAMNRVCDDLGLRKDEFTAAASYRLLKQGEW